MPGNDLNPSPGPPRSLSMLIEWVSRTMWIESALWTGSSRGWCGWTHRASSQSSQSTATASASQISRMRTSLRRPRRSVSVAIGTFSTESRFAAQGRGTGSTPGSSTTSLARPLMVVVQGATTARRSLGIAASRDRTMTGRRDSSGSSHHHTSPRKGRDVTPLPLLRGMTPGHPKHPSRRSADHRMPNRKHRSPQLDCEREARSGLRQATPNRSVPIGAALLRQAAPHPPLC